MTHISNSDRDFYAGVLAALAIVAVYDQQTLFDDIVNTMDAAELVQTARDDEQLEISGLARYGYADKYPATQQVTE